MNPIIYSLIGGCCLFLATTIGSLVIIFKKKVSSIFNAVSLSLSGAIMFSCSCFGLILPAYSKASELNQNALVVVAGGFSLGCLIILVFDYILKHYQKTNCTDYLTPLSITLHNIPEGLIVGVGFGMLYSNPNYLNQAILLMVAIAIQNIPEGLCISLPLYSKGHSKLKSISLGIISGSVEILSCLFGTLASSISNIILPFLLSLASGAMIIITVSDLLPEAFGKHKTLASLVFAISFILMFVLENIL